MFVVKSVETSENVKQAKKIMNLTVNYLNAKE